MFASDVDDSMSMQWTKSKAIRNVYVCVCESEWEPERERESEK